MAPRKQPKAKGKGKNKTTSATGGAGSSSSSAAAAIDHDTRTCGCCNLAADAPTYSAAERDMMAQIEASIRAQMIAAGRITGEEDTRAIVERQEREREARDAGEGKASEASEGETGESEAAASSATLEASASAATPASVGEVSSEERSSAAMEGAQNETVTVAEDRGVEESSDVGPRTNAGEPNVLNKNLEGGEYGVVGGGKHGKKNADEQCGEGGAVASAGHSASAEQLSEMAAVVVTDSSTPADNGSDGSSSAKDLHDSPIKIHDAVDKAHETATAVGKEPATGAASIEPDVGNSASSNTSDIVTTDDKTKTPVAKNTRSRTSLSHSSAAEVRSSSPAPLNTSSAATTPPATDKTTSVGYMTIFHVANEQAPFDPRIYTVLTPEAALACERERYAEWWRRSFGHAGKMPPVNLPVPYDTQDPRARWRLDKRVGRNWSLADCAPMANGGPVGTAESVVEPLFDDYGRLKLPKTRGQKATKPAAAAATQTKPDKKQGGDGKGGVEG
ncbi:uncharacterized protein BKCO1_3000187 [Diplodia corticola]|uniref:Uncharacterized protein n=1 Tax=Diplodia corticola TaxID=236234 RepID=A0A1J9SGY6_9PEZI|nr:uncharacterized protein BKCO1_3000187 [Diplodia corticola]OJD38845.1 hypothetical protein BKCO1_3000187 [Diplodia corticola]